VQQPLQHYCSICGQPSSPRERLERVKSTIETLAQMGRHFVAPLASYKIIVAGSMPNSTQHLTTILIPTTTNQMLQLYCTGTPWPPALAGQETAHYNKIKQSSLRTNIYQQLKQIVIQVWLMQER